MTEDKIIYEVTLTVPLPNISKPVVCKMQIPAENRVIALAEAENILMDTIAAYGANVVVKKAGEQ